MKYPLLITFLFLSTAHASHAMEIMGPKDESAYNFLCSVYNPRRPFATHPSTSSEQSLATAFCFTGIAFNELPLIRRGIDMGADINYCNPKIENLTFIQIACRDKNADIVAELLKVPTITINTYKENTKPAFHYAVDNKDKDIINLLLAHDPEAINVRDTYGNSCLHLLCAKDNNKEILEFLLSKETINPNTYNNDKETPLHIASYQKFTHYIQALLVHKADTRALDNHGRTPLHLTCRAGKIKSVKLLLTANTAEINSQDYEGDTPLHTAYLESHTKVIILLLKKGAIPTIKNIFQRTPLATAYFEADFFIYSPSLKKLLLKKDEHRNTQLHLATFLNYYPDERIDNYLSFLVANGLSVWKRNKKKERPVDCACKEYAQLYKQYMAKRREYLLHALNDQEKIMHAFLRLTSPKTECALFTAMINSLSSDLLPLIACYYYGLNIETIVARKYKYDEKYYNDYIDNKNMIRNQLRDKPEPKLLWSAL